MAPKENANPSIRSVENTRSHARRTPFEWSQLGSFEKGAGNDDPWIPTTSEDRAILQALVDVSKATHGKGVSLLENVGLVVPESNKGALQYPHFHINGVSEETKTEPASNSEASRDIIDPEEVFDIIRNIQDPEHPHTLQELGVVSLEQVEVVDEGPSAAGAPCVSTVSIRFT
jgi:hypothetical protein